MPSFYPENNTSLPSDNELRSLHKIVDLIGGGSGGGGAYASGGNFSGSGSPEGVVTASPGATYVDTDLPGTIYAKRTGTGNTGWTT